MGAAGALAHCDLRSYDAHSIATALITGAGSGIGRAVALAMQADGYDCVLAGRRKAELEKTAAAAKPEGGRMLVVATNVADPVSVNALFARTKDAFGRLDVLFNNAGTFTPPIPIEDLTLEQWQAVVDVNLTGAFLCAQGAIRMMKAQIPEGRAHHQQWLDLGPHAAAALGRLHGDQARHDGPDQVHLSRRPRPRHRLLADRHRQRGDGTYAAHGRPAAARCSRTARV